MLSFALALTSAHKLVIIGITFTANTQREVRLRGEKISSFSEGLARGEGRAEPILITRKKCGFIFLFLFYVAEHR